MTTVLEALPGFKFGCDPELFVLNPDGEYVTAEGLIPGTKESPYKVDFGAVQVDGMAAEFNIDPVTNYSDFNRNITQVLAQLRAMLPRGYKLSAVPAVEFSEKAWGDAPDVAKILGCNPDFNAWTGTINPPPNTEGNERLRTASGHLHFGWTEDAEVSDMEYVQNARDLVKQLDWYLGAWSVIKDPDARRRTLYGKAGACRFKDYGVEYRVLSNFWLSTGATRLQVWNRMQKAIYDMRTNFRPESAPAVFNDLLIQSIDTSKLHDELTSNFFNPIQMISF